MCMRQEARGAHHGSMIPISEGKGAQEKNKIKRGVERNLCEAIPMLRLDGMRSVLGRKLTWGGGGNLRRGNADGLCFLNVVCSMSHMEG